MRLENEILSDRVENSVGKEENAGFQHFLLFPQCFERHLPCAIVKTQFVCKRINAQVKQIQPNMQM